MCRSKFNHHPRLTGQLVVSQPQARSLGREPLFSLSLSLSLSLSISLFSLFSLSPLSLTIECTCALYLGVPEFRGVFCDF